MAAPRAASDESSCRAPHRGRSAAGAAEQGPGRVPERLGYCLLVEGRRTAESAVDHRDPPGAVPCAFRPRLAVIPSWPVDAAHEGRRGDRTGSAPLERLAATDRTRGRTGEVRRPPAIPRDEAGALPRGRRPAEVGAARGVGGEPLERVKDGEGRACEAVEGGCREFATGGAANAGRRGVGTLRRGSWAASGSPGVRSMRAARRSRSRAVSRLVP